MPTCECPFSLLLTWGKGTAQKHVRDDAAGFRWPSEVKNAMSMAKSQHFLGFTGRGDEVTNANVDNRDVRRDLEFDLNSDFGKISRLDFDFVIENATTVQRSLNREIDEYKALAGRNQV